MDSFGQQQIVQKKVDILRHPAPIDRYAHLKTALWTLPTIQASHRIGTQSSSGRCVLIGTAITNHSLHVGLLPIKVNRLIKILKASNFVEQANFVTEPDLPDFPAVAVGMR